LVALNYAMRKKLKIGTAIALVLLLGVWFFYPKSTSTIRVVGSLSPAAVEDIVDMVQGARRHNFRKALFSGQLSLREAWNGLRDVSRSNIEAFQENPDGSVGIVSQYRYDNGMVIHGTGSLSGWTANWPGTRGRTNAPGH